MARSHARDAEGLVYLARLVGWRRLAAVGLLQMLASLFEGVGLLLLVPITQVVAGDAGPDALGGWGASLARLPLPILLAGFVALIAARSGLAYAVMRERTALALGLVRRLRIDAQAAVLGADWRWLSTQRSADHAAVIVNQAERVGREANRSLDLATCLVTLLALLAAAVWLAWELTLATLALGTVTALVWVALKRRTDALGEPFDIAYRALQRHVTDGMTHLRAARIAGAQGLLARDFNATARSLETLELRYTAVSQRANMALQVVAAAMLALLVWLGLRVFALPLALFVPVLAIFARIVPLISTIQQGLRAWRFCRPALDDLRSSIASARAAAEPASSGGEALRLRQAIELVGVDVSFPGRPRPVLAGFSLTVRAGSVVGISGPSGSGKSTLADLLSGLAAPDRGTITVDGTALEGAARIGWRRQVAYVEQSPYLFDGTVAENLAWGLQDVSREALVRAIEEASASFVHRLPLGLDTPVGEVGRRLSGGERQRIALARALLRDPQLVILDEVTAALDTENEAAIARTIDGLRGQRTFVILGHRPALHAIADTVIALGGDG